MNFAVVWEMPGNWPFVRLLSRECQGKSLVRENCYNVCMVCVADTD